MCGFPARRRSCSTHALDEVARPRRLVGLVHGPQVGLEVLGESLGVCEADLLGVLLDEEVERIDHLQVGDQADGDRQAAGAVRKNEPGKEIAEGILLPVDEVVGGLDGQRVSLDRRARVWRRAQPDDVRMHLHQPIERVAGAMLQRHFDAHRKIPSQGRRARIAA